MWPLFVGMHYTNSHVCTTFVPRRARQLQHVMLITATINGDLDSMEGRAGIRRTFLKGMEPFSNFGTAMNSACLEGTRIHSFNEKILIMSGMKFLS